MKAYTTIEESKQLIEAGLDVNTADMYYEEVYLNKNDEPCYITPPKIGKSEFITPKQDLPCWSLVALIDLIPDGVHWYLDENGLTIAEVDYYKDGKEVYVFRELYRNPVDAIVWLLENNYIKNDRNS